MNCKLIIRLGRIPKIRLKLNDIVVRVGEGEVYRGAYEVTSSFEDQTLPTANKLMARNVTIYRMPIYETFNLAGGYTLTIGDE